MQFGRHQSRGCNHVTTWVLLTHFLSSLVHQLNYKWSINHHWWIFKVVEKLFFFFCCKNKLPKHFSSSHHTSFLMHLILQCDSALKYLGVFDSVTSNAALSSHKWPHGKLQLISTSCNSQHKQGQRGCRDAACENTFTGPNSCVCIDLETQFSPQMSFQDCNFMQLTVW